MFIVRNTFIAKPGCASKLAGQLKESVAAFQMKDGRVLTDMTGDFNRVIMEHSVDSLEELERRMKEIIGSQLYRERMAGTTELWITGSREILRVM